MERTFIKFVYVCVSLSLLGCGGKEADSSPDVLSVNGVNYTQGDWDSDIAVREVLYSHRDGRSAKSDVEFARKRDLVRSMALSAFVNDVLWRQSANLDDDVPGHPVYSEALSATKARYAKTFGRGTETFDDLTCAMTNRNMRRRFIYLVTREAAQEAYCLAHHRDDYTVTSNLVETTLRQHAQINAEVAETNRQIYVMASNLVTQARAGKNFAELADRFSQDREKELGGSLGECDKNDFPLEGDTLWPILERLREGGTTDVLETEDGLCIYRCDAIIPESEKTGEFALKLSRICLYRAIPIPEQTFDQCWRQLARERRQDVVNRIIGERRAQMKIRLPQGTGAIPKAFLKRYKRFIEADSSAKAPCPKGNEGGAK